MKTNNAVSGVSSGNALPLNEATRSQFLPRIRFDLFTSTMGTIGLGLTWRAAADVLGAPPAIGEALLIVAAVFYVLLLILQLLRLVLHRQDVVDEWRSPTQFVYFSAATISGSLLALAAVPYSTLLANCIWWPATLVQLLLLFVFIRRWILVPHHITELGPTWLIPMVGNASPAFAGIALGHEDLSRAMLMSSILCWLTFQPLILFRLVFSVAKIPPEAIPSLNILVSAPAVIAIAVSFVFGGGNVVSELGTYYALFFAISIATLGKRLVEVAFSRRWWGFTFPMAALSSVLIRLCEVRPGPFTATLSISSLVVATAVVATVAAASLHHLMVTPASARASTTTSKIKDQVDATI